MKRLAILLLLAAITGPVSRLAAADVALPLPTGMAPTSPRVPAPVIVDGLPVAEGADWSRTSFRDRLGVDPTEVAVAEPSAGPRVWSRMTSGMLFGKKSGECSEPHDPWFAKPQWCEPCAPAVRYPLPPLPAGLSTSRACNTGSGAGPACAPAKSSGSCCQKLKNWLCFRETIVRTPQIPTPKDAALYTYFPTVERAGVCATGNCGAGGCATGKLGRGANGSCVSCPAPGESLVPGYRLANPEAPANGPVTTSSFKAPINR